MNATDAEFSKALNEIDFGFIRADYLRNGRSWFRKLCHKFGFKRNHLTKLDFLEDLYEKSSHELPRERAHILLGGIQYAQAQWGDFPDHGPLYRLLLKRDDLNQLLSQTTQTDEVVKNIFINPEATKQQSFKKFKLFMARNKLE